MAKLTRDTALRSLEDLFRALPRTATIELTKLGMPPPRGTAVVVKIEVATTEELALPAAAGQAKAKDKEDKNEDVPGQRKPELGTGGQRRRGQAGQGPS